MIVPSHMVTLSYTKKYMNVFPQANGTLFHVQVDKNVEIHS